MTSFTPVAHTVEAREAPKISRGHALDVETSRSHVRRYHDLMLSAAHHAGKTCTYGLQLKRHPSLVVLLGFKLIPFPLKSGAPRAQPGSADFSVYQAKSPEGVKHIAHPTATAHLGSLRGLSGQ